MTSTAKVILIVFAKDMKQYTHNHIGCCEDCLILFNSELCRDARCNINWPDPCGGHWPDPCGGHWNVKDLSSLEVVSASIDFVSNEDIPSCSAMDVCGASEELLAEYRKHARAREKHPGFFEYTYEDWYNFYQEQKREIRVKKLTAFLEYLKEQGK